MSAADDSLPSGERRLEKATNAGIKHSMTSLSTTTLAVTSASRCQDQRAGPLGNAICTGPG